MCRKNCFLIFCVRSFTWKSFKGFTERRRALSVLGYTKQIENCCYKSQVLQTSNHFLLFTIWGVLSQEVLGAYLYYPWPQNNHIKYVFFLKNGNMRFGGRLNYLVKVTWVDNSIGRIHLKCLAQSDALC